MPKPEENAEAVDYELHFGQGYVREYTDMNHLTFSVRANVRAGPADFSPLKGPREARPGTTTNILAPSRGYFKNYFFYFFIFFLKVLDFISLI